MSAMSSPKIPPLQLEAADSYQRDLLGVFPPDQLLNLFTTLAHHSKLLKAWLPLGGRLLYGGTLPERDREVLILTTSACCNASYEWGQHVAIARHAGLSDDEIIACSEPLNVSTLAGFDHVLQTAANELVGDHRLSDKTWDSLAQRYDDKQLIEVTMLVGHYVMLAGTLNSIGVALDGPLPAIGHAA